MHLHKYPLSKHNISDSEMSSKLTGRVSVQEHPVCISNEVWLARIVYLFTKLLKLFTEFPDVSSMCKHLPNVFVCFDVLNYWKDVTQVFVERG